MVNLGIIITIIVIVIAAIGISIFFIINSNNSVKNTFPDIPYISLNNQTNCNDCEYLDFLINNTELLCNPTNEQIPENIDKIIENCYSSYYGICNSCNFKPLINQDCIINLKNEIKSSTIDNSTKKAMISNSCGCYPNDLQLNTLINIFNSKQNLDDCAINGCSPETDEIINDCNNYLFGNKCTNCDILYGLSDDQCIVSNITSNVDLDKSIKYYCNCIPTDNQLNKINNLLETNQLNTCFNNKCSILDEYYTECSEFLN